MGIRKVKAKSGKIYLYYYPPKIRKQPKGERRISKSGNKYYNYYTKKDYVRKSLKINRKVSLDRADNHCQLCGRTNTILYAHHLDNKGVGKVGHHNANNLASNLIIVCPPCHQKLHHGVFQKHQTITLLYQQGFTLKQIGDRYGVSRQRIHQILSKSL